MNSTCFIRNLLSSIFLIALSACGGSGSGGYGSSGGGNSSGYGARVLVSDGWVNAANTDSNLINGWGVAFSPNGYVWITDNGTNKSTLYDGNGLPQALVVSIPAATGGPAAPTGIVYNGTMDFMVSQASVSAPALFLFCGEGGTISGWSPTVNSNTAVTVYDGSSANKVYKGLAIANNGSGNFLFVTDFHNNSIDVFDAGFNKVSSSGGFVDANLPAGYAPYGIQTIANQLYVTFAKQDAAAHDNVNGAGLGLVDVFDANGNLIKTLVPAGGKLNGPWAMAMAPANFGTFSNDILVGNFGDGSIDAYDPSTGTFKGRLSDKNGTPLTIDGLWGFSFGNGMYSQPTNTLFYAAGPNGENDGVYGRIDFQ